VTRQDEFETFVSVRLESLMAENAYMKEQNACMKTELDEIRVKFVALKTENEEIRGYYETHDGLGSDICASGVLNIICTLAPAWHTNGQ